MPMCFSMVSCHLLESMESVGDLELRSATSFTATDVEVSSHHPVQPSVAPELTRFAVASLNLRPLPVVQSSPSRAGHLSCASSSDFKGLGAGSPSNDRLRWPKNRKQFNTVLSGPARQMKHQILALDKIQASQRHFCLFAFLMWLGSSQVADRGSLGLAGRLSCC